ncbi:hypothetical protein C0993_008273, partial [Termitomyces sp. T159_Od127]
MENTAQCMPPCNHFSAPKWDESKPRELTQYFKELEYLFRDCGITDHTQMKEYAARYIMYNTAETWTGLSEFAATTTPIGDQAATAISYKNWKEAPQVANNTVVTNSYIKKEDMEAAISAAVASAMIRIETMINTQLSTPCTPNAANSLCYFCGELGHTMSRGCCNTLEQYIHLGWVRRGTDSKVILSTGTNIPNYLELKSYQERVNEWHRRNPGNVATGTLSGNANPDADQHVQQQLIHEVLHLDSVGDKGGLSKESRIAALEMELNALKNQVFDGVEVPRPKQPLKGYKPMATIANDPALPAPEAPSAPTSTVLANNTPTITNVPDPLPLLHPYSGLNNHYQPPAQQNFGASDKRTDGAYQPTAPVYDIEKFNQVFAHIMKLAVTLSVEELCSIAPDVRNQIRTAVTPKHQVAMGVAEVDELDDTLLGFMVTSDTPPMLSTNAVSLTPAKVTNTTSIDPIKTYVKSLDTDKDPAILMVAHDSQAICSIMMTIDHCTEVEAVVDSGSQIISMVAEVASDLGLIYDSSIVLNMQSANGTINRSLGLAKNVPCTIGDITFYLQIHIIRSPAYDLLLGRPVDVLARSI